MFNIFKGLALWRIIHMLFFVVLTGWMIGYAAMVNSAPIDKLLTWTTPTTRTDGSELLSSDIQEYRIYQSNDGISFIFRETALGGLNTEHIITLDDTLSWYIKIAAVDTLGQEGTDSDVATWNITSAPPGKPGGPWIGDPPTGLTDLFDDPDGTILTAHDPSWASIGGLLQASNGVIISNALQPADAGDEIGFRNTASTSDYSKITLLPGSYGERTRFVSVRMGADNTGYSVTFTGLTGDTFANVAVYVNGTNLTSPVWVANVSTGQAISRLDPHELAIHASGTGTVDITVWLDGVELGTVQHSGSVINSGNPGAWNTWLSSQDARWDNWSDF